MIETVDLDLDTLKREILGYLDASGFAVFRSHPGGLESLSLICWDSESFPDYQQFLETARKLDTKLIIFASREFEASEIDEELEELEECEIPREERRTLEKRLKSFRDREGTICGLELAFDYHSRLYVYEVRPDWYDDFLEVCGEIAELLPSDDAGEGDAGMGGFYSNN